MARRRSRNNNNSGQSRGNRQRNAPRRRKLGSRQGNSLNITPAQWVSTTVSGIVEIDQPNTLHPIPFSGNPALKTLLAQAGEYRYKRCSVVWNPLTASTASGSLGLYIYFDDVNQPSDLPQLVSAGVVFKPCTAQQRVNLQYTSDAQSGSDAAEGGIVYWWANGTTNTGVVGLIHYVIEIEQRALKPASSVTIGTTFDGL